MSAWLRVPKRIVAPAVFVAAAGCGIAAVLPLAWMVSTALKPPGEVFKLPVEWLAQGRRVQHLLVPSVLADGINQFKDLYFTQWNLLMAAAVLATLPCVVLLLVAQRVFVRGVVVGPPTI